MAAREDPGDDDSFAFVVATWGIETGAGGDSESAGEMASPAVEGSVRDRISSGVLAAGGGSAFGGIDGVAGGGVATAEPAPLTVGPCDESTVEEDCDRELARETA